MENIEESSPLRITPTVRALSSALRGKRENVPESSRENGDRIFPDPEKLWFKESSAKNLRNRDFLSPTTMLNTLYADGQVGLTDTCWLYPHFNVFMPYYFLLTLYLPKKTFLNTRITAGQPLNVSTTATVKHSWLTCQTSYAMTLYSSTERYSSYRCHVWLCLAQ